MQLLDMDVVSSSESAKNTDNAKLALGVATDYKYTSPEYSGKRKSREVRKVPQKENH